MGNLDMENLCNCENNDSKIETSFKTNQNNDKMLCPFINTVIYQNYNIDNNNNNKTNLQKKKKELNFSKQNAAFNNYDNNFEYNVNNSNKLKDSNKLKNQNIFNFNNNNDDLNNDNKYGEFMKKNKKETEEKVNKNVNKYIKSNENASNNTDITNLKTNIDKPKNNLKNGLDIQIWGRNCYYFGYFKDGIANGLGKFITGNNKYFGEFKNDQANGFGLYHNNINETIYEGYWINNLQGKYGIEKWSDDSIFFGEYLNGEKRIGTFLWKDGSRYEGEFINNMFEGYGFYFYSKNKLYFGEWKNNRKHGLGQFIMGDKLYVGNYFMDQKNGFGISYWKNEDKLFVGLWKNNKKNGFGKFFHGNKIKYGIWGENYNKKVEWFNSDKEAYNYLANNNLELYKKYFDLNKDNVINYYCEFNKIEDISPCIIPNILIE